MTHDAETSTRTAYDTVADVYADHVVGTEPEQSVELAMIDHFARLLPGSKHVLDAGCGAGRMLSYLAARGCRPEGVDLSAEMVRRAQKDYPNFTTSVGTLADLAYADQTFDGVFSWYSLIHTPDEEVDELLSEMIRVVRPGGYLLMAFQAGEGSRRVGQGFAAFGHDVVMYRYHRTMSDMSQRLLSYGLALAAQLERAPINSEVDPQVVIIARCP